VALVLFMNVPFFDANRYSPPGAIFTEGIKGAFPDGGGTGAPNGNATTDHGGGQGGPPPADPDEEQTATSMDHRGGRGGPPPAAPRTDPAASAPRGGDPTVLLMRRYSTATGYVALVLLGITLLVGPANLLLGRRNPRSSYLSRDVGIGAAVASVTHVVFGFLVKHVDGQVLSYFLAADDRSRLLTNSFGLANWAGLAAVVIVVALAAISSDAALRKLKYRRWKRIQRLNYALFALVVVHSLLYGALWRLTSPYTVVLGLGAVAVLVGQAVGFRLWRRRNPRQPATATA
jgi:sulfoxide reductase heme-binding subunit YedZ